MNPAADKRIEYLDGWRGLAIALVLVAHFTDLGLLDSGRLGVDLFFVLSGLLMSRILFVKQVPLKLFYWRRCSRIFPVFYLFVASIFVFAHFADLPFSRTEVAATLVFLRTYLPAEPAIWTADVPLGHLWSLNVEEHSYLVLSLLTVPALVRRRPEVFLVLIGLGTLAVHAFYALHSPATRDLAIWRTESVAGMIFLSAGYALLKRRWRIAPAPWLPLLALAAAVGCYAGLLPPYSTWLFTPFLLGFAVNHLDGTYPAVQRALAIAPLRTLGLWSYSLYLWQEPFHVYRDALPPGMALAGALLLGAASFHLFENPARTWLNRKYRGPADGASPTSPRR